MTPELFQDQSGLFAYLEPSNGPARKAFHATVAKVVHNLSYYKEAHKQLFYEAKDARESSPDSDDEASTPTLQASPQEWSGAFVLSLDLLPREISVGWRLGCQGPEGREPSDFLLCPRKHRCKGQDCSSEVCWTEHCRREHCRNDSCQNEDCKGRHCKDDECRDDDVLPNHAILQMHDQLPYVVLTARHSVTVSQPTGKVIHSSQSHVLVNGELIMIGRYSYIFHLTPNYKTLAFQNKLVRQRKQQFGPDWHLTRALTPASVADPVQIGQYYSSPRAFAEGTFGSVFSAWQEDGADVFAIKRFKKSDAKKLKSHMEVMNAFDSHDNVIELVEVVHNDRNHITPDAYAIYYPFVTANLREVISGYRVDLSVKMTLFRDYLDGLARIHRTGIMHRDIKPTNLGVLDFQGFKGVILDLDEATISPSSFEHNVGTVTYLAPEIMELKDWEKKQCKGERPAPYEEEIDLFALGLSMHGLYHDRHFSWEHFATAENPLSENHSLTKALLDALHTHLDSELRDYLSLDPVTRRILELVKSMVAEDPADRKDAMTLLESANLVAKGLAKGGITPITQSSASTKRPTSLSQTNVKRSKQG